MNTELTDEQITAYQRDGFLVKREFLSPAERDELLAGIEEAVEQLGRYKLGGDLKEKWLEGSSYYDRVFLQRINLWKINDTVKKYMRAPELGSMLCRLEGIDGIRIWHDQTLQKQPWANPTAWHSDNTKWSYSSLHAISIWIALDPATLQNGCMYYLPGSHKNASRDDVGISEEMGLFFDQFPPVSRPDAGGGRDGAR